MKKKVIGICLLITLATTAAACSKQTNYTSETPYYSVTLDGEKQYYTEDEGSVKQVLELTNEFVYFMNAGNADYENLQKIEEEKKFYTKEYAKTLEGYGTFGVRRETTEQYHLKSSVSEHEIKSIELKSKHGQQMAVVICDYITSVTAATDDYVVDTQIETGTNYRRTLTMEAALEDNQWKVMSAKHSAREEVK